MKLTPQYIKDLAQLLTTEWNNDTRPEKLEKIILDLLDEIFYLGKPEPKVSRTGDNELLIWLDRDNGLSNIIIDEDLDASWIFISRNPNSKNHPTKYFNGLDLKKLAEII